jgi:2-phosphoglycerate kinase
MPQRSDPPQGRQRLVTVLDGKAGLPFSKGLMATSIMAAGLPPARAYQVAEVVERRLHDADRVTVSSSELRVLAAGVLEDEVGPRYAENYRRWQRAQDRTVPLIVLIGGATGVGKSTIATTIAARLGIVRIVSTDAIREVMRGIFTREMMPTLHASSYDVAEHLREPPFGIDPVIAGFRRQVQAVSVGVTQLLRRAVVEGTDLIVEGAHLVPGFMQLPARDEAIVAQMIITVDDEATHRSHFDARSSDTRARRQRDYTDYLDDIRTIQTYVTALAVEHGVPVVSSYSLDTTVSRVMELVVSATTEHPDISVVPKTADPPEVAPPRDVALSETPAEHQQGAPSQWTAASWPANSSPS